MTEIECNHASYDIRHERLLILAGAVAGDSGGFLSRWT